MLVKHPGRDEPLHVIMMSRDQVMPIHDWARVDAGIFHEFHYDWIFMLKEALNQGLLPPDYYALAEQVTGGLHPDVLTLERKHAGAPSSGDNGLSNVPAAGGGVAVAVNPPRVQFTASAESELYARKSNRIAIRHI